MSLHSQKANKDDEDTFSVLPSNNVRNNNGSDCKKRKLGSQGDPKFEEFLDVMRPPTKAVKVTDTANPKKRTDSHSDAHNIEQAVEEGHSDGEYLTIPERDHGRKETISHDAAADPQAGLALEAQTPLTDVHVPLQENPPLDMTEQAKPAASDQDWLRSRTSRTLDLAQENDDVGMEATAVPAGPTAAGASVPPSDHLLARTSNTGTQVDEIQPPLAEIGEFPPRQDQEKLQTGRLFIRNLSYKTSENEIRELFDSKQYGLIEEASLISLVSLFPMGDSRDEYPDRDNLCYAYEVIRKMILVDASQF